MAVTDDFNRANSGTLGANWTDTAAGIGIISNAAQSSGSAGFAYYSGATWNATHSSQAVFTDGGINGGPTVRHQVGGNAYVLYLRESLFVRLYYYDGSFNLLDDFGIGPTIGRTYKIEVTGTTIRCYENGVQLGSDTTNGSLSNGAPGLFSEGNAFDDWEGTGDTGEDVPIGRQLCS